MTFQPQMKSPVDPVKLEKLAEVAVKVGLGFNAARIW